MAQIAHMNVSIHRAALEEAPAATLVILESFCSRFVIQAYMTLFSCKCVLSILSIILVSSALVPFVP